MMCERTRLYEERHPSGEARLVEEVESEDEVYIVERTSGPDTEATFGDEVHEKTLRMGEEGAHRLCEALGGEGALSQALVAAFADGGLEWLSDVQDLLDQLGIQYVYDVRGPRDCVYRPAYEL